MKTSIWYEFEKHMWVYKNALLMTKSLALGNSNTPKCNFKLKLHERVAWMF